jgi:hypothetical protein
MEEKENLKRQKLKEKADEGSITAIQILEKMELEERLRAKKEELMSSAQFGRPEAVVDLLAEIPRLPVKDRGIAEMLKELDIVEIERHIRTGEFKSLPEHMAVYLNWMERAHDWYYKFKDKNWIVKYLMATCKDNNDNCISYYLANKVFADMLTFFYSDQDFKRNSWMLYLAERVMMGAQMAWEVNDFETYGKNMDRAAAMIAKVTVDKQMVDPRLLDRRPRFFFTNAEELGLPKIDRNALARGIDEMAIPEKVKQRAKQDLGTVKRDLLDDDILREELEETK